MSLSAKIREQLINSFRAELVEHVQTMNDGLLALEQDRVQGKARETMLEDIFRAAHSLKGAARAVGVTVIEQLAHSLESVLDALQHAKIDRTPELFTACYKALDAVQSVQAAYEAGETTPPVSALQALAGLEPFLSLDQGSTSAADEQKDAEQAPDAPAASAAEATEEKAADRAPAAGQKGREGKRERVPLGAALHTQLSGAWEASQEPTDPPAMAGGDQDSEEDEGEPQEPLAGGTQALGLGKNGTIRVSVAKLDALMNQLNELLAAKIRAEQQLVQMRDLQEMIDEWQKEWLQVRGVYNRLSRQEQNGLLSWHRLKSIDALRGGAAAMTAEGGAPIRFASRLESLAPAAWIDADNGGNGSREYLSASLRELGKDVAQLLGFVGINQDQLNEMGTLVDEMSRQYASDTTYMGMVIDELEEEVKRVRMLPLTTITHTFGRMVRDLSQQAGKKAVLEIVGGDTELDKQVLEQIKDPLVHLLRNAVDHGIEPPEQRVQMGKPPTGTIALAAEQSGKNVVLSVSDDGSGLDYEAIRKSIARRGVLDIESLTEADLREAIFQSGVSTNPIITDLSGRGVGLDVVRKNVEGLQGMVNVNSGPSGTAFTLTLPLRLASSRGLMVRAGGETFAIPLNNILKIERYAPEDIASLEGHDTIRYGGQPLTLVQLSDVLELPPANGSPERHEVLAVIVAAAERRMAFAVDELVGEQEMVIKPLGSQLSRVGGIAGATVLGNRDVILVLNMSDLIKLAMRGDRRSVLNTWGEAAPTEQRVQKQILVVDDSITTRTLEKNILEAAGYIVRLATHGKEALSDIAASGVPDLIVSDVAMPQMNGFELTERIKQDEHMGEVPVILVTSLDSNEDKARGIEVGADAYIVKSSFDQDNLLETIEQMI